MSDLSLQWADDLVVDESGDLAVVDGTDELQQRVIRRFLTTPQTLVETTGVVAMTPDYLFEPSYGGGARAYVAQVVNAQVIQAVKSDLIAQANQEAEVDPSGTSITVTVLPNGLVVGATVILNSGQFIAIPQLEVTN